MGQTFGKVDPNIAGTGGLDPSQIQNRKFLKGGLGGLGQGLQSYGQAPQGGTQTPINIPQQPMQPDFWKMFYGGQ